MTEILENNHKDNVKNLATELNNNVSKALSETDPEPFTELADQLGSYQSAISNYVSNYTQKSNNASAQIEGVQTEKNKTLFLEKTVKEFFKKYSDLISPTYIKRMQDNVEAAGRRYRDKDTLHTHVKKIMEQDDIITRNINA